MNEDEKEIPISLNEEPEQTDNEIVTKECYYDSPDEEPEMIDMPDENDIQETFLPTHEIFPDEDDYAGDFPL